ncbi:5'-3' exonuclease PLD3 isoform 2-T2 [Spinachia spinachia]
MESESGSELVWSEGMATEQSVSPDSDEEATEEAGVTELKYCSVVLDRLQVDNKAAGTELEEKEDMNPKGVKPFSRIPTFHKRPANAAPPPEPPGAKKDPAGPGAQSSGKVTGGSAQADIRARAPPQSVLDVCLEAPFSSSRPDLAAAATPPVTAPKMWGLPEPAEYSSLAVIPRPAIRPRGGGELFKSEQTARGAFQTEADAEQKEGPVGQKPPEDPEEEDAVLGRSRMTLAASGDTDKSAPEDCLDTTNDSGEEAITDEQPPWETEPTHAFEYKDSRSSSDNECDNEFEDEKAEAHHLAEGHSKPLITRPPQVSGLAEERANSGFFSSPVAPEKPTTAQATRSAKSSGGFSFALFCILPTTLLLLGGFGQHVWRYGLPLSVAQLTAQLELHWLEGLGLVPEPCSTDCRVQLVESIPVGLYQSTPSSRQSIADSWLRLLDKANSSVHIAAFYFTLRDPSESQGRLVFEHLKRLKSKGVELRIAVNSPQTSAEDTAELAAAGAEVREVDLKNVTGGIVHTKLWVVDQKHFYLGSANMDWRSLSQVKEVGLSVEDCSCLAQDASRIFEVYWSIGGSGNSSLPPYWPARLSALSSSQNPLRLKFNGVPAQVYLSSAPPQISARGRSNDLSTILSVIGDAHQFVHISVMDYLPLSQYTEPLRFWPAIDSALRAAACTRDVQVRLLVSCWKHSPASMFPFLQSLLALNRPPLKCDIEVKVFTVASTAEQMRIPFARVNHAKFMVTDRVVYIGTSNWSENYFSQTAGAGLVVNQTGSVVEEGQETLQSQAEELFLRDWKSEYASGLSLDDVPVCPHTE